MAQAVGVRIPLLCAYDDLVCGIDGMHDYAYHCYVEEAHCTYMDEVCSLELRAGDHSKTCCVCKQKVICVCEPATGWVNDQCPVHGEANSIVSS